MPGLATDMGMRAPRRLFPQRHQRVTRSPGERGRRGSKTGSHRRQTWGDTRRHRATMGAASWLKARHLATSRNGRIAPEKRKVGGSTPPLTTTTSDQRKRCCLLFRLPCVANGFANASLHGLAFTAWAKMSPTPAACSRRAWGTRARSPLDQRGQGEQRSTPSARDYAAPGGRPRPCGRPAGPGEVAWLGE